MLEKPKKKRVQSPSSINCYRQCPRKYFYCYIKKLKTAANIHTIRGNIVHTTLEDFFNLKPEEIEKYNEKDITELIQYLQETIINLFNQTWKKYSKRLDDLKLDKAQLEFYFDESIAMIDLWLRDFMKKLKKESEKKDKTYSQAFNALRPILREKELKSTRHNVRGFIDAIHSKDKAITILDYKTSKKNEITDDIRLQLAIYALLFQETYGKLPHKVGAYFLKHGEDGEKYVEADEELLQLAKLECELIDTNTQTVDKSDYPKKKSGLCKWATGQCDFYDVCNVDED